MRPVIFSWITLEPAEVIHRRTHTRSRCYHQIDEAPNQLTIGLIQHLTRLFLFQLQTMETHGNGLRLFHPETLQNETSGQRHSSQQDVAADLQTQKHVLHRKFRRHHFLDGANHTKGT